MPEFIVQNQQRPAGAPFYDQQISLIDMESFFLPFLRGLRHSV
jgi:hypothetical protein